MFVNGELGPIRVYRHIFEQWGKCMAFRANLKDPTGKMGRLAVGRGTSMRTRKMVNDDILYAGLSSELEEDGGSEDEGEYALDSDEK